MTGTPHTDGEKKSKKRRGWARFIVYLFLLVVALIFGGFLAFAKHIADLAPPSQIPNADGIVVWTGKGGGRLDAGARLLREGHGERLLISGVNPTLEHEGALELLGLPANLSKCCVDLDYAAQNTIGNARETARWANVWAYEHIILVTSSYHMPRAEIEIGAVAGRIRISPYPVMTDGTEKWWRDGPTFRRLSREYGKLLLTYLRDPGSKKARGAPMLDGLEEQDGS